MFQHAMYISHRRLTEGACQTTCGSRYWSLFTLIIGFSAYLRLAVSSAFSRRERRCSRLKRIPIIIAKRNIRRLQPNTLLRIVCNRIERHDTVVLVGKHARRVVGIYDRATAEDEVGLVVREKCDFLVRPAVKIFRSGMSPVLILLCCQFLPEKLDRMEGVDILPATGARGLNW